ncbi:hypothetical protein ZWY2020_018500 [Hordeum vulgare]|nr:hypothetical protein ZWY2020_018500 [Hordeum vulgare]
MKMAHPASEFATISSRKKGTHEGSALQKHREEPDKRKCATSTTATDHRRGPRHDPWSCRVCFHLLGPFIVNLRLVLERIQPAPDGHDLAKFMAHALPEVARDRERRHLGVVDQGEAVVIFPHAESVWAGTSGDDAVAQGGETRGQIFDG